MTRRDRYLRKRLLSCLMAGAALLLPLGCLPGEAPTSARPLVLVSVLPYAGFVERLAGDAVAVEVLVPPGANPATHMPSIGEVERARRAALYVRVGHPAFPFEQAWFDRVAGSIEGLQVVDGCQAGEVLAEDPHVWLSPAQASRIVERIAAALIDLLPEQRAAIAERREAMLAQIRALDAELSRQLHPHRGRTFFAFHPAWGYFARYYGLVQRSIEHEHKEPSAAHLQQLIEAARGAGARVIFVQPQFSKQAAQTVADAVDAGVVEIDPLRRDWFEGMRAAGNALAEAWRVQDQVADGS